MPHHVLSGSPLILSSHRFSRHNARIERVQVQIAPHGSPLYLRTVELRREVLRLPLGLDFSAEELQAEHADHHLAILADEQLAGCLVLSPVTSQEIKMRQVCVRPDHQGLGLGAELVRASERFAREQGYGRMILHARTTVVPFYERLGYDVEGEEFEEVTIPHRAMAKRLA